MKTLMEVLLSSMFLECLLYVLFIM